MADQPKLVIAGDSEQAQRAIAALERKFDSLENKLKHVKASSQLDTDNITAYGQGVDALVSKFGAAAVAAGTIGAALKGGLEQLAEFNKKLDETNEKVRQQKAKWQVQDNLSDADIEGMMPNLRLAAQKTPVMTMPEVIDATRQLSSAGFDEADVKSGKATEALLKINALSNTFGDTAESPEVTANSLSQFLGATGSTKKAEDLQRVGEKLANLSADSPIQASHLKQLSQNAATLTQFGLNESEQLAAFRPLMEAQGDAIGATGLRNLVSRLGTAGTDKKRTEALQKLKLTPKDVAIAQDDPNTGEKGVDLIPALEKLREGMKGLAPAEQNSVLKDLVGEEAMASANILLSDAGFNRMKKGLEAADNAGPEAQKRIERFQNSREAFHRQNELGEEIELEQAAGEGITWDEYSKFQDKRQTREMRQSSGLGRVATGIGHWMEDTSDSFHKNWLGQSPEGMHGMEKGTMLPQLIEQNQRELQKQTELLEQIAKNGQKAANQRQPLDRMNQVEN